MTATQIITALTIHLLIPLTGLLWFLRLSKQIKNENIPNPPTTELFVIFSTYGGLILVALTTLSWQWSGMASLGTFYLIFGAPIVMGIITYRQKKLKNISIYHRTTYYSSLLYFVIAPISFLLLFLISDK
jgi:hypothetical protein